IYIMDASALAAIAALKNARFPKYENDQLDYKTLTKTRLPVTKTPIAVTVSKIGSHLLVDTSHEEEPYIEARLTVTTAGDGSICALQKGGEATLTLDEIKAMVELAKKKARELEKYLEA
ncbi:RNA-binding protein, partial [Candidatus Woesearchaeota archaeon]|nr:RNA-binding protein [Candidatus Woesearchaeota archaeon]